MSIPVIPIGATFVTATLLLSANSLPAGARYLGEIDISSLHGNEIDAVIEYSIIVRDYLDAIDGVVFQVLAQTRQPAATERHNIVQRLFVQIENITNADITFVDKRLILGGFGAASGFAKPRPTLSVFTPTPDAPFIVKDRDHTVLDATATAWQLLPTGAASTLNGHDGAYYLNRANHSGIQALATVDGLSAALSAKATTSDIDSRIAALVGSAPILLDTLGEIAAYLTAEDTALAALTTAIGSKQDKFARISIAVATASLAANATDSSKSAAIGRTGQILGILSDGAAWVRVYRDSAARTADAARLQSVAPAVGAGVVWDSVHGISNLLIKADGPVPFANMEASPLAALPMRITNLDSSTRIVNLAINVITLEA